MMTMPPWDATAAEIRITMVTSVDFVLPVQGIRPAVPGGASEAQLSLDTVHSLHVSL